MTTQHMNQPSDDHRDDYRPRPDLVRPDRLRCGCGATAEPHGLCRKCLARDLWNRRNTGAQEHADRPPSRRRLTRPGPTDRPAGAELVEVIGDGRDHVDRGAATHGIGVALRASAVARAQGGDHADAEAATHEALQRIAIGLQAQALVLLDEMIDVEVPAPTAAASP